MVFPLAYLGYLGIAALAGFLTSCNRENEKPEIITEPEPKISAEPAPPILKVSKEVPAYGVYLQLLEAGLSPYQLDVVNSNLDETKKGVHKDGEINEEDLFHAGRKFYRSDLSPDENKMWKIKIETSFQEASDRYLSRGAEQNGITAPEACKSLEHFKRAVFWNYHNDRAQMILGVCQSDPKRILHALEVNPNLEEAKEALEKLYREATEKNPKDAKAWKNLGDALKMQDKWKDAQAAFQKAQALDPSIKL
jgi:tetratricopeptide (TPR) repeat protein